MQINQIEEEEFIDLVNFEEDCKRIEIDVKIIGKIISHTIADDGNNMNIMPLYTIEKLRLQIKNSFKYTICTTNQILCQSIEEIKDLRM